MEARVIELDGCSLSLNSPKIFRQEIKSMWFILVGYWEITIAEKG